jgi:hypothetical protein
MVRENIQYKNQSGHLPPQVCRYTLNQFELQKANFHPLDMKSVSVYLSLWLSFPKNVLDGRPCGLLHLLLVISIALVNLHRQQSNGLYAIFGDEV